MASQISAIPTTLKVIHLLQADSDVVFAQFCSNWQDFNWHSASRGPSV